MASPRKRTQCSEERAIQIQHAKRSIKPNFQPTSNSIETVDKPRQFTKEYSLPKKNHRLLYEKPNATELKEILVNFILDCKRRGFKDSTIETKTQRIKLVAKYGANILDPESVKDVIAKLHWENSTKREAVRDFCSLYYYLNIQWERPIYKAVDKIPFIPTEEELDMLISASSRLHAPLLQFLKESGARIGEASQIEWTDVDFERKIISVNHPEKGSKARLCPISEKLRTMLGQLPRPNNLLFRLKKESLRKIFEAMRNRTATKMANPRLQRITFHTFRHWKGTTEYHKTKDIIHVASILGHKDIKSTMKYIAIENALYSNAFDDEWTHKVSHSIEEEGKLINAGFELVRAVNETTTIYRKRK